MSCTFGFIICILSSNFHNTLLVGLVIVAAHQFAIFLHYACFVSIQTFIHNMWLVEQAKIKALLCFHWWILHLQHICIVVLGDKAQGLWCQYVTPCCNPFSDSNLLHCQVQSQTTATSFLKFNTQLM